MTIDAQIERIQDRIELQLNLLADSCRDLFEEYDLDLDVFEHKLSTLKTASKAVASILINAKKSDLPLIDAVRDRAIDSNIWTWCYAHQTLRKAGVKSRKDDLEQRALLTCLDHSYYKLGSLLSKKYKWLPPPDVQKHLDARDYTLQILGIPHDGEWK